MYKILYIVTKEITLLDIPRVLDEQGHEVYQADFGIEGEKYNQEAVSQIVDAIQEYKVQYVISYDFIQTISQACMEADMPYIAWVYDAPQKELYTHFALYPCNYIFAFDKKQVQRLRDIGIKHVEYMPLAVHVDKVKMVTETIGKKMKGGYQEDVSFIGKLYKMENEDVVFSKIDKDIKREIYQNIDDCFMKWDKNTHMYDRLSDECVAYLVEQQGNVVKENYPYMSEQFFYETAILSRMLAYRERVHILNKLGEKYNVSLYTFDKNTEDLSDKVQIKKGMPYDVLSHVYRKSKINLHISLHCIETGVSQRVFDIMAAGAFVLSNYQEELEELFVPGEEIVMYHNEQELEELVAYYLTHDEEREEIVRRGQEKVLREYNYHKALKTVFEYVEEKERGRKESYIAIQRKELEAEITRLLEQKTEQDYEQLYNLCSDKKYETVISKSADLCALRIMAGLWKNERNFSKGNIFDGVDNISQAEHKYIELKHGLWRIENNLSYDKCMEVVEKIQEKGISQFVIARMIYANLRERESVFINMSKYMAENNLLDAIELLTYGLLFMEKNKKLLLQKAEYLLKLNLFAEALKTLQIIEEPDKEIVVLKEELSKVVAALSNR